MDAVLRTGEAASLPRSPRGSFRSTIATHWRRIVDSLSAHLAGRPPAPPRELPPEWFRYPPY